MNKNHISIQNQDQQSKPRRLGRGLSALLGEPVAIQANNLPVSGSIGSKAESSLSSSVARANNSGVPLSGAASKAQSAEERSARADEETGINRVVQVPLDAAEPNQFQPRRTFNQTQLSELAASIRSAGVVQPILVRPLNEGRYEIVGERRWRACRLAGLTHVPAVISKLSDEQAAEWALVENIQRADLSPMERAWAVRGLCDRFGLSHAQVGERLGIDRSSAANLARLTELEQEIRDSLDSGGLSAGHGKVLVGLTPGPVRVGLAKQAASQGWSVRRLEQAAGRAAQSPQGPAPEVRVGEGALAKAAALKDLEKQLSDHLGTSVRVRASAGGKRGSLVVKFFDLDHFDGLMSKIGFVMR
jgi:ParB family transcriptional regulator, chromosome partitioning protein